MEKENNMRLITITLLFAMCFLSLEAQIAIKGDTVYTMAGDAIKDGVVLIRDGKIVAVGTSSEVIIPDNCEIITAKVVTPGLIDARSVVGLGGILNQSQDQDQLEHSQPMQPELRAIDAYNALDPLVAWIRQFGVTTVHTGHAPGMLISGQTMIVKTHGVTIDDAVIVPLKTVSASLGAISTSKGSPGTRGKAIAMLRGEFLRMQNKITARENKRKKSENQSTQASRNIRDDTLEKILNREIPLMVYAQRYYDILAALRVAKEFNINIILEGASEAYLVLDEIKKAKVPVIVHPTMSRTFGDKNNMSMENAAILQKAGITIAMQSGYEGYVPKTRVVLFEAAIAATYGLGFENALKAITIDAAKLLGIDNRVGSLEVGKDADIALYDGDPFEYITHCTGVLIDGVVVSSDAH